MRKNNSAKSRADLLLSHSSDLGIEELEEDIEDCIFCKETSRGYWWGEGCVPVCQECAFYTLNEELYEFAVKNKYGPIPDIEFE